MQLHLLLEAALVGDARRLGRLPRDQRRGELVPYPASSSASGPSGFCKHCGIAPYARGDAAEWNEGPYVSINLACLDDLTPAELLTAPVEYLDGRADTWETPAETRHL